MMQLEGGLSAVQACDVAKVSRAGFYRAWSEHTPLQADNALRDQIQEVALENRCYGYRRVVRELEKRGLVVNHKRVLRLMREDNLLSLRRRKFVLTTQSGHGFVRYPNLAAGIQLTGVNQLWVADITYIRLRETFVYLAVVLDAYSRRVLGWELGESLETRLALQALDRALSDRVVEQGTVHHSDQGVQYCSPDYVDRLLDHGFVISMSRKGRPYDNAKAESFMKTLKSEEVYLHRYRDLAEARASIGYFIDEVYNRKRMHSALGYRAPDIFEADLGREEER